MAPEQFTLLELLESCFVGRPPHAERTRPLYYTSTQIPEHNIRVGVLSINNVDPGSLQPLPRERTAENHGTTNRMRAKKKIVGK